MILQIKLIIAAIAIASTLAAGYGGYSYIKSIGYNEAKAECDKKFKDYNDSLMKKIEQIETNSTTLVENSKKANDKLSEDITTIMKSVKGKTLTVIKNGECTPSQTFSDTINSVNKRINGELKK